MLAELNGELVFYPHGKLGSGYVVDTASRRRKIEGYLRVVWPATIVLAFVLTFVIIATREGDLDWAPGAAIVSALVIVPCWLQLRVVRRLTAGLPTRPKPTWTAVLESPPRVPQWLTVVGGLWSFAVSCAGVWVVLSGAVIQGAMVTIVFGIVTALYVVIFRVNARVHRRRRER